MSSAGKKLFLGLDCSTQSFKAVVTEAGSSHVLIAAQVNFEEELGEPYPNKGGMER
jgi:sugar (pentulose or hexulose) kinase